MHLLVDEMTDIDAVLDVKLHQQVVVAGGGVDLRGNLGTRQRVGNGIGVAELALDLHKKRNHRLRPPAADFHCLAAIQQKPRALASWLAGAPRRR